MIDTFIVTISIPATDSLFREACAVFRTPTGSVEVEKYPAKTWRGLDGEVTIRDFIEARLINHFPARRTLWHGSRCVYYHEGAGIVAVVEVDSDHYDGSPDKMRSCGHPKRGDSPGCGEMSCPNYVNKREDSDIA